MNRLAVGQSARPQQAHKVDNRIDRLHKVDNRFDRLRDLHKIGPLVTKFYSGQDRHKTDRQTHDRHTWTVGNPRSAQSQLWQTMTCYAPMTASLMKPASVKTA